VRANYVALKKSQGVYSFGGNGISMSDSGPCATYVLNFRWPKRAPPATYDVRVYEVLQGAVVRETSVPLSVVRTGFPAWLAYTAAHRASEYGIVAVLIGALAGFGIDRVSTLLFGKKRSAAH
jgi:Putative transmembrane protein (Alph_Pro_TM)